MGRRCVKTLAEILGQEINCIERSKSDHRHFGNGFGTPKIIASRLDPDFHTSSASSNITIPRVARSSTDVDLNGRHLTAGTHRQNSTD